MATPGELFPLLEDLDSSRQELPEHVWHEWLWGTDPEEAYHVDVLLNRNHLLGLLVCRYKYMKSTPAGAAPVVDSRRAGGSERMTIMDKPTHQMTWRELKDTVANVLFEWPAFLDRLRHNMRPQQNLRQVEQVELMPFSLHGGDWAVPGDASGERVCEPVRGAGVDGRGPGCHGRTQRDAAGPPAATW
jgi:hypothetical protein